MRRPTYGPINLSVVYSGKVKPPRLDNGQLTKIGAMMVKNQLARWKKHTNAYGNEAKPLSRKYTFIKKKVTGEGRPYRDNHLSGLMIQNFSLRKAIDNEVRAENTSRKGRQHANGTQSIEEMIGLSGTEQVAIIRATETEMGRYVKGAWMRIK